MRKRRSVIVRRRSLLRASAIKGGAYFLSEARPQPKQSGAGEPPGASTERLR